MTVELGFNSPTNPIYNASGTGRRLRSWRASSAGPNTAALSDNGLLIPRSRAAVRNNPYAGAAVDKRVSNDIGTGIQAKAKNGTKAERALRAAVWDEFVKFCDADGVFDFYGLQSLVDREWSEAGEVFIRLRQRRPSDGFTVPLQLQVIESEQCPRTYYSTASNGNYIRAGIEFNAIGQRVAYWMYGSHPGDAAFEMNTDALSLRRVPADQIIHVFEPLRAGQIRGIPSMSRALTRMFNLENLDDAVIERMHLANMFLGTWTPAANDDPNSPGYIAGTQTGVGRTGIPEIAAEPGTINEIPAGSKLEWNNPPDQGPFYAQMYKVQLQAIAAAMGIPYEVLTGDLTGVSDRALKLLLNEFRRFVEQRQWLVLIPMLCQRVREAFFDAAVLAGAIDAPDYATKRAWYVATTWVPQGYPYSHPVQDVDADMKAVRGGFKSRSSVILGNGDDPEDTTTELAADNAAADANGLILDSDPRYTSDKGMTQAKPEGSVEPANDPATADPGKTTPQE